MWGANRVIDFDNMTLVSRICCANYVGGFLLASELPNEVGQQQGCLQRARFQAWVSEHLTRRKDQEYELIRKFSNDCLLLEVPANPITCGGEL